MNRAVRLLIVLLGVCALAGGCAHFTGETSPNGAGFELPPVRLAPDSVTLDLLFIRVPAAEQQALLAAWRELDEQQLPAEVQQQLAENGLRCGMAGLHLPEFLAARVREQQESASSENEAAAAGEVVSKQRRLQARSGTRSEVVLTPTLPRLSLLTCSGGQVRGRSFTEAQGRLAMLAYPCGDGQVRLEMTPEIHFGPNRNRWVGSEGMFRLESGNERYVLDQLKFTATLGPGETLVLSTLPEPMGLGRDFFVDGTSTPPPIKLLLIRLSQTRADDLHGGAAPTTAPAEG